MLPSETKSALSVKPLRVLHVVSGDLWAGAESQVFQLVGALQHSAEIDVRVATMNPGILTDRLGDLNVAVDVFDESHESTLGITRRLVRIARKWRPAVVHTHRRKEHIVGGLAALSCGARAIATIHGSHEFRYPWWQLRQSLLAGSERIVTRHIHRHLVAVSDELAADMPGTAEQKRVIPNGIDVDAVRASALEQTVNLPGRDGRRIAFLGRLVPVKQVHRIVETIALLQDSGERRWSLFIIGDGPLEKSLRATVSEIGLDDSVHFVGFVPNPLPWLAQMDALVFASEHEGLPMTALEALALGVPVVSPDIGGLTALIREAELGCIAPTSNPSSLADAIRGLPGTTEFLGGLRESAVPMRYTIEQSAADYIHLYQNMASDNAESS